MSLKFLKRRYEESEKRRSTAEKEAEAELDEACSRAAEEYERRRQRLYGATVVDGETLLDGHRMQMDAALASFRRNAGGHPEWQVGKYEKVLTEMLDARHDDLEKRMAEERKRRRLTSLVTFSAAVLSGTATANATTKTALGTGLVVGSFIAGWWLSPGIVESRLGGNVVVPEAPHQTAQRKRRRYQ
ncbi:unnamed protein product [Darwinula stevensoni]|uniref:Uncharacterized protein n=1 Tax=Darwinula stevensoni TaxID=69355 RepID=A0A7R9FTS1_9CRUS|nr:unnamed protein product [Darwinula stevensoni]CAG0906905.1 unnamed protein product [Darwinula stevensoni]